MLSLLVSICIATGHLGSRSSAATSWITVGTHGYVRRIFGNVAHVLRLLDADSIGTQPGYIIRRPKGFGITLGVNRNIVLLLVSCACAHVHHHRSTNTLHILEPEGRWPGYPCYPPLSRFVSQVASGFQLCLYRTRLEFSIHSFIFFKEVRPGLPDLLSPPSCTTYYISGGDR